MTLRLESVGQVSKPFRHAYAWRDYALYHLGIGAGPADLAYLLEDPPPVVVPTFGVIPSFEPVLDLLGDIGGNLVNLLHNGEEIVCHRPWPARAEVTTTARVSGIWDMKVGGLVSITARTEDRNVGLLCETTWQLLLRGEGGFGGPRPPALLRVKVPDDRKPVLEDAAPTLAIQGLLYRLSGDINPIHANPEVARAAGFDRPILHGLATLGWATRVVLRRLLADRPERIASVKTRFLKVVYPGDTLIVRAWDTGDALSVTVTARERDEQVLAAIVERKP